MRRGEVEEQIGLSSSSIYRMVRAGDLPRPIKLSTGAVRWIAGEIDAWVDRQPRSRGEGADTQAEG